MASPGNRHCANCIGTLSFRTVSAVGLLCCNDWFHLYWMMADRRHRVLFSAADGGGCSKVRLQVRWWSVYLAACLSVSRSSRAPYVDWLSSTHYKQRIAPGPARRYAPPTNGSSTVAKIAADLRPSADWSAVRTSPVAYSLGSCAMGQTDRRTATACSIIPAHNRRSAHISSRCIHRSSATHCHLTSSHPRFPSTS